MASNSTNATALLLKGAGAGSLVIGALYILRSMFMTETATVCSSRYPNTLQFSLKSQSGKLMTSEELEARAGIASQGFRDNASVVAIKGGPAAAALRVRLAKNTGSPHRDGIAPGGISANWTPASLEKVGAACLTYHVFLPGTFDFAGGGSLPGLLGGAKDDPGARDKSFAERLGWLYEGAGVINAEIAPAATASAADPKSKTDDTIDLSIPPPSGENTIPYGRESFWMPKGRWVAFEQEVVLNEPGTSNGVLRLWVDGELKIDSTNVNWRSSKQSQFTGVALDVSYGAADNSAVAPADTNIDISPLVVRWK